MRYRLVKLEMSEKIDDEFMSKFLSGLISHIDSVGLENFFNEYNTQPQTTKLIVAVFLDLAMQ